MLELIAGKYRVTIVNDPTHIVGSADNVHSYDHEYHLDDARAECAVTSRYALSIFADNECGGRNTQCAAEAREVDRACGWCVRVNHTRWQV